ncbi:SixA phosphatase family protein [Mucilaginibacter glaciei]|uniref:Histidine phosphatase family protein n=1 Tax=Mucilaginibacter glaciei TaxID=2772109 RepID=A0A926NRX2_9SPHI|nr:histidine phosphatase family protein [Mucilaginibacter glaciei]MBD1394921.1 histidine phosphatase family protein [Mucilaginibacter glaciei]
MKTLLLVRHANALHESVKGDFYRHLSAKGLDEAKQMAVTVKETGHVPQLIISSEAARALTTATIFADTFGLDKPKTNAAIYEGNEQKLLRIINKFPDGFDNIALVGHNPDISNLLLLLTGQMRDVPTCTVASISFEFDEWETISANTGDLDWYSTPENS